MVNRKKRLTVRYLEKLKVPKVLIAGLLIAGVLGWTGWTKLSEVKNYYQIKQIFPKTTLTQVCVSIYPSNQLFRPFGLQT